MSYECQSFILSSQIFYQKIYIYNLIFQCFSDLYKVVLNLSTHVYYKN